MSLKQYNAFIRFFGVDGRRYNYTVTAGYLPACRREAKLYVQKAFQYEQYDGGYIVIRLPAPSGSLDAVEVEQWAFTSIEHDGHIFAKIWRSDIETCRMMEKGESVQSEGK